MAGPSWLVDKNRIATKIKSASGTCDPERIKWQSNPTRACPNCQYTIDNSDVAQEWPGLPKGVKFDPTDQEIIWHLIAKSGAEDLKPHPFIDEFIITVDDDEGICCSHPHKLPSVKQDGSASHFFHRAIKAYNTGTRKRRKIHDGDGDVRWHKTGRTKPVMLDGVQRGCKKIMVLYMSMVGGGKPKKTNWVMHQYHLGTEEDEKDGDYVISKIYYQQQQQVKQADKTDQDLPENFDLVITKVDPVTPKSVTPEPPRTERKLADFDLGQDTPATSRDPFPQHPEMDQAEDEVHPEMDHAEDEVHPAMDHAEDEVHPEFEKPDHYDQHNVENEADEVINNTENNAQEDPKWWDSESQNLLDSQQLVEGLALCDDLLQSQSPIRAGHENDEPAQVKPRLADYAKLGPENLKKDLEECENIVLDPPNIMLEDTPPDFRLSQLEFGSQESFLSWGVKLAD
ncbi:unnamed protein product [Prunus armeniaca]|uniref:NAC domain-containing protein n=1 Tax=Prunus armeniaca TaxID=36596 RepID=A0A6J5W1V2_PRUAR|nr:unnamed protein product [Prunus armeniaca]